MSDAQAEAYLEDAFGLTFLDPRVLIVESTRDPAQDVEDMGRFRREDVVDGVGVMGGSNYTHVLTLAEFAAALQLNPGYDYSDYVWFTRPSSSCSTSLNLPLPSEDEPEQSQDESPEQDSERSTSLSRVEELCLASMALTDEEWHELLDAHRIFLEQGGGGGAWMMLSAAGFPLTMYQGPAVADGEQLTGRLKNIAGRDLSGQRLDWANLSGIHAPGCVFAGASLQDVAMTDSILRDADFAGASMSRIDLSGSALHRASFVNADLRGADFEACDLTDADFTGANLDGASFKDATLTGATPPAGGSWYDC